MSVHNTDDINKPDDRDVFPLYQAALDGNLELATYAIEGGCQGAIKNLTEREVE